MKHVCGITSCSGPFSAVDFLRSHVAAVVLPDKFPNVRPEEPLCVGSRAGEAHAGTRRRYQAELHYLPVLARQAVELAFRVYYIAKLLNLHCVAAAQSCPGDSCVCGLVLPGAPGAGVAAFLEPFFLCDVALNTNCGH